MKKKQPTLTSEKLRDRFENPFALVNYAISLAKNIIVRGEEEQNPANVVLSDIRENRDLLQDEEDDEEGEIEVEEASSETGVE